jgi:hypothetical protein
MARAADGDAGGEIQEPIAVNVPDFHTATMRHDEWLLARIGWRYHFGIAREDCASFRSGQFRPDSALSMGVFVHALT